MLGVTNDIQSPLAAIQKVITHGDRRVGDNVFSGAPTEPSTPMPLRREDRFGAQTQ